MWICDACDNVAAVRLWSCRSCGEQGTHRVFGSGPCDQDHDKWQHSPLAKAHRFRSPAGASDVASGRHVSDGLGEQGGDVELAGPADPPARPTARHAVGDWRAWAVSQLGLDPAVAEGMTKEQLRQLDDRAPVDD